jgi:predicted PurR-regulated permease PerM
MPTLILTLSALALCWVLLPVYQRLLPRWILHRNAAAATVMLLVLVVDVLPSGFVTASLGCEAWVGYQRSSSGS